MKTLLIYNEWMNSSTPVTFYHVPTTLDYEIIVFLYMAEQTVRHENPANSPFAFNILAGLQDKIAEFEFLVRRRSPGRVAATIERGEVNSIQFQIRIGSHGDTSH
jgi:hypothetical protein